MVSELQVVEIGAVIGLSLIFYSMNESNKGQKIMSNEIKKLGKDMSRVSQNLLILANAQQEMKDAQQEMKEEQVKQGVIVNDLKLRYDYTAFSLIFLAALLGGLNNAVKLVEDINK